MLCSSSGCLPQRSPLPAMPGLLLAGGRGSRLRPITDHMPKCLVPIQGKALLGVWIEKCLRAYMNPIMINLSYLSEKVEEFLFSFRPYQENKERFLLLYEAELKGTGGTVLSVEHLLNAGTFFVAHADNLSVFSMEDFYFCHQERPAYCILTAMSFLTHTPQSCGIFETDAYDVVQAFHEKVAQPPSNVANGAVYFMEPPVLDILKQSDTLNPDISIDLLPQCLGRIRTFANYLYHRDIGTVDSYSIAQQDMKHFQSLFL